ncbi:MAG: hypothetical protein WBF90_26905 [Rivularia sp. (in: cyanobacteria)]
MSKASKEKIGVQFYRLTKEEIKQWYRDKLLSTAGYLLAIKKVTKMPGSSLVIPNVLQFCREWEISKSAFYRAVNELRQKGYMDWEATHGIILKETKKVVSFPSVEEKCPTDGTVSHERDENEVSHERENVSHERDNDSHERDNDSHERENVSHERDSDSHERENRDSKPAPDKNFGSPQIITDITDPIQTLSEDERESFLEFSKKKANQLPKPPELPLKWIKTNFEELRNLWEKQSNASGSIHCEAANSTNILDFENWHDSRHQGQYHALMNLGLAKFSENSTSKAWYEWAKVKYPERFVDVPQ